LVSRFVGTMDAEQFAIERARRKKLSSVPSQKKPDAFGTALTETQVTALTERAKTIGAGIGTGGLALPGGVAGGGPIAIAKGIGSAVANPLETLDAITDFIPGQFDDQLFDLTRGLADLDAFSDIKALGESAGDSVSGIIGPFINKATGGKLFPDFGGNVDVLPGGLPMPVPGTGRPLTAVADISVGGLAPAMGTITRVWDTWPGPGVTGGGRAPIFFRTIDGKTFVRKIDGTIKKVPKSTNLVLNTRKINLNTFIRMDRAIERISARIAKKSKRLKRQ